MRKSALIFLVLTVTISCEKKESEVSVMSLLKQHDWFIHNIQSERFDDIAGTLLGDTAYIAENCMQNSIFRFLEDSIFERTMHCNFESLPYTGQGKWQWSPADSILTSYLWFNHPPASGYPTSNFGLGICKLLDITTSQLVMKRTEIWYDLNNNRYRYETTYFCNRKN